MPGHESDNAVDQGRTDRLFRGELRALELLTAGAPLSEALQALTDAFETHSTDARVSIRLAGEDGTAVPPEADETWSVPIVAGGTRLGDFDIAFRPPRDPTESERKAITLLVQTASLAIERRRADDATRVTIAEQERVARALRRSEQELADFFENATLGLHWVGPDGIILRVNRAELELLGYERDEYVGHHIAEFHVDEPVIEDILTRLHRGEKLRDREARMRCRDGSIKHVLIDSSVLREDGRFIHTRCFTRDVTERRAAESLLAGQKLLLEKLAKGAPVPELLQTVVELVEAQSQQGVIGSILMLDDDGRHLRHGAAPNLPPAYSRAIDGVAIGPVVGSCGTAAFRKEPVVVTDIATDPLWAAFRDLALKHGLRACWSYPIIGLAGNVLGTFAIYRREPGGPTAEDRELIRHLGRTAAITLERRLFEHALAESEQRLRLAIEGGGIGVWRYDLDERTFTTDGASPESDGAPDVLTYDEFLSRVHPEDRPRVRHDLTLACDPAVATDYDLEHRLVMPDGSVRWIAVKGRCRFRGKGLQRHPVRMMGVSLDITDRKKHDEQMELVMDELNHRVKNTLAVVDSIAQQTLRNARDLEDFRDAFSARLRSLAQAHRLLTATRWDGAALNDLVRTELEPRVADWTRLHVEGPDVVLRPSAALALHMVIHELCTNACKYGALSVPEGRVTVIWRLRPDIGQNGRLDLDWVEHDGPEVTPPRRRGFGTRVLEHTVDYELDGRARMQFLPEGFRYCIEVPWTRRIGYRRVQPARASDA